MSILVNEQVWFEKPLYAEAERKHYEKLAKSCLTPLADEVAKARQRLIEIKHNFDKDVSSSQSSDNVDKEQIKCLGNKLFALENVVNNLQTTVKYLKAEVNTLKKQCSSITVGPIEKKVCFEDEENDEDVDLFDSDSEEDETAAKIREERLAAYNVKKSKKPTLIAKSNVILDVKPWDDEIDMIEMEKHIRNISADGLLLGASKLVPVAYGIKKLQISCVIEDDKVSVDWLQEQIEAIEDYVQSVDIAAFNKI